MLAFYLFYYHTISIVQSSVFRSPLSVPRFLFSVLFSFLFCSVFCSVQFSVRFSFPFAVLFSVFRYLVKNYQMIIL